MRRRRTALAATAAVVLLVLSPSADAQEVSRARRVRGRRQAAASPEALAREEAMKQQEECPSEEEVFDFIVAGGGPSGIIVAERLSASLNHKVLLLEAGDPGLASNGAWQWKLGTQPLADMCGGGSCSMFDVLGCYENLWDVYDSQGKLAVDVHEPHILGGGSVINAGLWFVPPREDFDRYWPQGWKAMDVLPYYDRVRQRLGVTNTPSRDGKRYNGEYYDAVAGGLRAHGWSEVQDFNDRNVITSRQYSKVFGHPSFLSRDGLRDTPARTYLQAAQQRPPSAFRLITGAEVTEIVRGKADRPDQATGVTFRKGSNGVVCHARLRDGGAVVVSAGAIGTPRVMYKSGIGPKDQVSMFSPANAEGGRWISSTAGDNLFDTPLVPVQIQGSIPGFRHDCRTPSSEDEQLFINNRSGRYASSGPIMVGWDERTNANGDTKYYQVTVVPHAWAPPFDRPIYSLNLYLCNPDSRVSVRFNGDGSLAMDPNALLYRPGTRDQEDMSGGNGSLSASEPWSSERFAADDYVRRQSYVTHHFGGSMRLGDTVDTQLKVVGTDNIYVADTSIFPYPVRVNPQATAMMVAERLADTLRYKA